MANMVSFALPTKLVESARRDPLPERREWVARLPGTVAELARRWSLRLGEPYQPGGECSWVAPVWNPAGQERVLKVGWRHEESAHEAGGLRVWGGRGAVLVYDLHVDGSTSALLLERCRPGTTLQTTMPEPEQDVIVAGLLRRLWSTSPAGYAFRPLQDMCDAWAAEFDDKLAVSPGVLDPGWRAPGWSCFAPCLAAPGRKCCCAPTCTLTTSWRQGASRG